MQQETIKYFKTFDEAWEARKLIPLCLCENRFQSRHETKEPIVRSFKKGYALQFGDCGTYFTKEAYNATGNH